MIHYIILSCKKLEHFRKIQKITWLKYINKDDTFCFLSGKEHKTEEENVYWTDTTDDYLSCPNKYIDYIRNGLNQLDKKWYFFCDDDSFVFPNRLNELLKKYDFNKSHIVMNPNPYEKPDDPKNTRYSNFVETGETFYPNISPLGGGGFAISRFAMINMINYLKNTINPAICVNSDRAIAHWLSASGLKQNDMIFNYFLYNDAPNDLQIKDSRFISFHRVSLDKMVSYCNLI